MNEEYFQNFILKQVRLSSDSRQGGLISPEYDLDPAERTIPPRTTCFICSLPRSGSTLLCEFLRNTRRAGIPCEYFNTVNIPRLMYRFGKHDFRMFLKCLLERRTGTNGVFGLKIHWSQFVNNFEYLLRRYPDIESTPRGRLAAEVFPDPRYVFITRRDKVRQAVSLWKAKRSMYWDSEAVSWKRPQKPLYYSFRGIHRARHTVMREENSWNRFFRENGIVPRRVLYEDLVSDAGPVIRGILEFLGETTNGEFRFAPPRIRRQSDALSEEWALRYRHELENTEPPVKGGSRSLVR
jgi:LPS sulfotransferase NodH